ncbi:CTAG/PCC1 family protein [Paracoccus sp. SM22M-07]|uniref:CTAG/PCC1 family protein n=1 Tax=Paracoccus sp. SM22M-07 TaxID=1520813 RepID=UPI000A404F0C|nr:CTAG/PCC1 family protein [Paracoccus sp. SM22M-07]
MAKVRKRTVAATLFALVGFGGVGTFAAMKSGEAHQNHPVSEQEGGSVNFMMPDLSAPKEHAVNTQRGCSKPDMPLWAQEAKPDQARQVMLLRGLYDLFRYQEILDRADCSCEVEYPSWNDADARYQALAPDLDHAELFRASRQITLEVGRIQKSALSICRTEKRG